MKQLSALFAAFALVLLAGSPAAAVGELGLSADGVNFTHDLPTNLFSPSFIWVPGDTQSATFYARNQGGSTAQLSVDLLGNHIGDLLDLGDVHVTADAAGATTVTASDGSEHRLLTLGHVHDNQVVPITVTVDFDFSSPNDTQLRSTDLQFRVNLTQTGHRDHGHSGHHGDDGSDGLPDTGAPTLQWLFALAAISLGGGAAILVGHRKSAGGAFHG